MEFCEKFPHMVILENFKAFSQNKPCILSKKSKLNVLSNFTFPGALYCKFANNLMAKVFRVRNERKNCFYYEHVWQTSVRKKAFTWVDDVPFLCDRTKNKTKACSKKLTVFFKNLIFSRLLKVSLYSLELHNPITCHKMMKYFKKINISVYLDSWLNYKVINEQLFRNQKKIKTFITVNHDMHFMVKPDSAIDKVFRTMTAAEPNMLHTTCGTEFNLLVTILAVVVTSALPDGLFLNGNRRNLSSAGNSSARLYYRPHSISTLTMSGKSFTGSHFRMQYTNPQSEQSSISLQKELVKLGQGVQLFLTQAWIIVQCPVPNHFNKDPLQFFEPSLKSSSYGQKVF